MELKRHWYFITEDHSFGDEITLKPRTPLNMGQEEPKDVRICVAPTAAHCASAIGLSTGWSFMVYQTKRKVTAVKPYSVPDSCITKEHWLKRPTQFVKVGEIFIPETVMWTWGARGDARGSDGVSQRKDKRQIMKFMKHRDRRLYILDEANQKWRMTDG